MGRFWLYQAPSKGNIKKSWSAKFIIKGKWSRIGLPSLLWTKSEEEFVCRASSGGKMKKNWFTRPIKKEIWEKKWLTKAISKGKWRIALPGFLWKENEEETLYQAFSKPRMKKNLSTRPVVKKKMKKKRSHQAFSEPRKKKNWFTRPLRKVKWRRTALPGLL